MERHDMLPGKAKRLYLEILKALNHGAALLAALGIRALIEAICIDFECTGRNLESRIETLVSKGHLAQKHAKFLHALRFMGNEAAHEINTPSPTELTSALDIVESLMQTIYTLDELASHLKSKQAKS
ncbi:MAG: DUF4145 domain-containing protein [candidate division Zixibacteria bacterium]|nr:DUF4145 domain-containing protein [candidate division Zixibacteria bacterium]